jgi:hypothetical protein
MTQFKAILATLVTEHPQLPYLRNMIYQNSQTFDYVGFFACPYIRNIIIPEFDHVNQMLECHHSSPKPTKYDNKFMHLLKDYDIAPSDNALDRDFWSHYVRDCIHTFIRKTWSYDAGTYGMHVTRADADQIIRVTKKVRNYGPSSIEDWETMIDADYSAGSEIIYSTLFDVKMNYNGDLGIKTKRPVYLYSYGSKGWANCMAFLLRMQWNNLCAQSI